MKHKLFDLMIKLGISSSESLSVFSDGVRDHTDIKVYKCAMSGILILDKIEQGSETTYTNKPGHDYFFDRAGFCTFDDENRARLYKECIRGKKWLDLGCGQGGLTTLLRDAAALAETVELQQAPRDYLNSKGIQCYSSTQEIADNKYDIITMFHVFEHLDDPMHVLNECYAKLASGGKLIIEVPHGNDALFTLYKSEAFKKFTLWSEHLILHTKFSLSRIISHTKFRLDAIKGFQRYTLSNHLHWLSNGKPHGHHEWSFLNSEALNNAYADSLAAVDMTDSIVVYCSKP